MRLSRWLRERKKRREAKRQEKLVLEPKMEVEEARPLVEEDPEIVPAESRFTEEYQEFIRQKMAEETADRKHIEEN